jgi:hypothetical protein
VNSDWQDASAGLLLDDLVALLRRFVVLTPEQLDAVALWIVHTHAFEAADATPYLLVTSAEKRSGKTRLLEVLELSVARPWFTGHVTAAVLVAKTAQEPPPTLLLDESDAAFKGAREYSEALRGILNNGYRRGGKYSLSVRRGNTWEPLDRNVFGPKAIAGIGDLPDTVADRGIPIRLQRKSRLEVVERFRRRIVEPAATGIHDRIASWAEPNSEYLRNLQLDLPEELGDRAQDVWEPLFAIADAAGGDWPARARRAAVELSRASAWQEDSLGVRLLSDIRTVFAEKDDPDRLRSGELISELAKIPESPWGDLNGKIITPQSIARLLKPYEIRTRELWVNSKKERGYQRSQFVDAWARYLPEKVVGTVEVVDAAADHKAAPTTPTGPTAPPEEPESDEGGSYGRECS